MKHILIVDDNQAVASAVKDRLEPYAAEFVTESVGTESEAKKRIQQRLFDVALVDLMLPNATDAGSGAPGYAGIPLGEYVKRESPQTVVVMYSQKIKHGREAQFEFYNECLQAGATAVYSKTLLVTMPGSQLYQQILRWLTDRDAREQARRQVTFSSELRTKAMIECVSEDTLRFLVERCLPQMRADHITALTSGFSGAYVFKVESEGHQPPVKTAYVMKASKSAVALSEELNQRPPAGSVYGRSAVVPREKGFADVGEWHGIMVACIPDAVLLRDYLASVSLNTVSKGILGDVVNRLLLKPAQEDFHVEGTDGQFLLKASACLEIIEALDAMRNWSAVLDRRERSELERLSGFIGAVASGRSRIAWMGKGALLHGDFHCRNVFVAERTAPLLIDFARSEVYPRLFDFAALDADLLFSFQGSKNGQDLEFTRLREWGDAVAQQFPFREAVSTLVPPNSCWSYLRQQLLMQMVRDLEDVRAIEYAWALLFHALRYVRFQTTTPPKRVFAGLTASKLLSAFRLW